MTNLVAVDIGGTHARFALSEVSEGRVTSLMPEVTLRTAEFASFETAWEEFAGRLGHSAPRAAAIAVAGPVRGEVISLTNNPWLIRPRQLDARLGLDAHLLINDFAAVAHAVAQAGPEYFGHICGPDVPIPDGVTSVVGPGTGLGVAHLWRVAGDYRVHATEGGHVDYAPLDAIEDAVVARLRPRHRRVSAERVVAGPGLAEIYVTLAALERRQVREMDSAALWSLALSGDDSLAAAALDRFCLALGSVAGDLALAQGAAATVIGGGVGLKLKSILPRSGFPERYRAKGRFEGLMAELPVKVIIHPQPGLLGAAAAFAQQLRQA